MINPAIVIVAFNRPMHLKRLLKTIDIADYIGDEDVQLIISIDYQDSPENQEVQDLAESFIWNRGNKRVLNHHSNLGLRNHILQCGDLTKEFEAIILLEDDLIVSASFYNYARHAANYYDNNDKVAGVSLYAYEYEELGLYRFYPQYSGKNTYFMQWAASWGQLWTNKQWSGFREWYSETKDIDSLNIPDRIRSWKYSWKKYYIAYLVEKEKFFVFPYTSFTTLLDDIGTNIKSDAQVNNVSLTNKIDVNNLNFSDLSDGNLFDCFFQPVDATVYIPKLKREIEVCFDFFGTKGAKNYSCDYVITTKTADTVIESYSNKVIPYELNITSNEIGNVFNLCEIKYVQNKQTFIKQAFVWSQMRKKHNVVEMMGVILSKIINKI